MQHFRNLIISASAGTGKTYRLSLEYIALIVRYYEHEAFTLDGILALTFTRKASFEIRDRILKHLHSLIQHEDEQLLQNLCSLLEREPAKLDPKEEGALISAYQEILCDKRKLQVMTIDSYISHIFRNIVRPLRSIDDYDIDLSAVNKRMPYLFQHLMQDDIRQKVDRLLQRKVYRSLDDYAGFFAHLINARWLYYVITYRCPKNILEIPRGDEFELFHKSMAMFFDYLKGLMKEGSAVADYLTNDFRQALQDEFETIDDALLLLKEKSQDPHDAFEIMKVLVQEKNIFSGQRIRSAEHKTQLREYQDMAAHALADHLYFELFLPEQKEILELWGIILQEYDRLIYRYKNMTYDDISWFTFEALFSQEPPAFDLSIENTATEFYHFLSHRTRFMLIDEFQDTSLIQFNILRPIIEEITSGYGSKELGGVIVVGDEKQSIFGWRGGERDLLLNLRYIIPGLNNAQGVDLIESWRSSEDIIAFVNDIFSAKEIHSYLKDNQMQWKYPRVLSAIGNLNSTIEYKCSSYYKGTDLDGKQDVYKDFVNNMILPALAQNPQENIAILCRKGDQLNDLQLILEEAGQSSIFQPSASIVEHHLVQPLIAWMRFVAYHDWYALLSFLRSDFILLSAQGLKKAADCIATYEATLARGELSETTAFSDYPELHQLINLAETQVGQSPYRALRELLGSCISDEQIKSKRDRLNLNAFLSLVKDWEMNTAACGADFPDLLAYIQENAKQEKFNQVSVEGEERLQLLTIHKSKGLQFDRVFVYYDLGGNVSRNRDKLYYSFRYTGYSGAGDTIYQSFHDIDAYAMSFHYAEVLRHSSARVLWEQKEHQSLLEELNTLYVAFTRAKTSLHIYFSYYGTKSWEEYYEGRLSKLNLPLILANVCFRQFSGTPADERGIYRISNEYPRETMLDEGNPSMVKELELASDALAAPDAGSWDYTLPLDQDQVRDWLVVYLKKRQHLYGDIVHYYLSFIQQDRDDEHVFASLQCLNRYGSLLPQKVLEAIFAKTREELRKHSYLFAMEYDKVFTEFSVFNYRIDRLMLNTSTREAWVIDFKTGAIHEQEQVDIYVAALQKLPAFSGYSFHSSYVKLEI